MAIWWCNQSRQWEKERGVGVVCSSNEADNLTYRKTVDEARADDVVVHYRRPYVVAFSRAKENGKWYRQLPRVGDDDYGAGWRFRTNYFDLREPIHRDTFALDLVPLIMKHYPINKLGNVREGYFFPFDSDGIRVILRNVQEPIPDWLSNLRGRMSKGKG
jgi:hypothetical protein